MIVYVLTHNEPSEGGSVEGAYSTEEKARDAAASSHLPADDFWFWKILPVEVDDPPGGWEEIRIK